MLRQLVNTLGRIRHTWMLVTQGTTQVKRKVHIRRPIGEVWEYMTDPPNFSLYIRHPEGGPSINDRSRIRAGTRAGGGYFTVWEPHSCFAYGVRPRHTRWDDVYVLDSVNGGTDVSYTGRYYGKRDETIEGYHNGTLPYLKRMLER